MNDLLTVKEVESYHPIFAKRGKRWIYREIREGKLPAINTSQPGYTVRYLISKTDLDKYLENLKLTA